MMNHILPAIVEDADIRTAEAMRVAYDVAFAAPQQVQQAIARYGQFIDNQQPVPGVAVKDFCLAVVEVRSYQETITPLRDYRTRLDDFDDKLALAVYRLLKK